MANQLVQWWRTERPQDASLSDEDLTFKIADLAPEYAKQGRDIFAEYPDFASDYDSLRKGMASEYRKSTTTIGGEVGRGLQRGLTGLKSTAYGAAALAADAMPGQFADPVRDAMLRKYKAAQEEAAKEDVVPSVGSYKEVSGARDVGQYLAGLAGEALPSIAESVVTGAIGAVAGSEVPVAGNVAGGIAGIVGKQAAKRLIAKKIAGYTAQEIEDAALRGVGSEALKQLVRAETRAITAAGGAAIANTLNSYGMSAGEIYGELATNPNVKPEDALGIAVTAAIPAAIADTALPGYVINKSGVLRRLAGQIENFGETEKSGFFGYVARLAAELPKTATMESGTEAFQELVNIAATKYGETGKFDLSLTDADKERIINAGIAGGVGGAVAAPAAAVRLDKQGEKPAEKRPEEPKQDEQPAAVTTSTQEQTPPAAGADVLEIGYDTNVDGIKELARRKVAGEDVSAEESQLKPDAARRYQREVIDAAEAKQQEDVAKAEQTAKEDEKPAVEPAAAAVATEAAPTETAAAATPAATSEPAPQTQPTPAPANANQEPSPVEVPGGEGTQAAAQVAEGAAAPVQEVASKAEAENAARSLKQSIDSLKSKITETQSRIDSLSSKADEAVKKMEEAQSLLSKYDNAEGDEKKSLEESVAKYGGRDALVQFIQDVQVIEKSQYGKTQKRTKVVSLKGRKDGRASVASELSKLYTDLEESKLELQKLESGIPGDTTVQDITPSDIKLDIDKASAVEEGQPAIEGDEIDDGTEIKDEEGTVIGVPGFYDAKDDLAVADQMNWLVEDYNDSEDKGRKEAAATMLGNLLTTGSKPESGSSSLSKRVTAWVGKDGKVLLSTSHKRSKSEKKSSANSIYRFANESEKAGPFGKTMGITEMLDAGYFPYASILLKVERPAYYKSIGSISEFDSRFAEAKALRDQVGEVSTRSITQDEQSVVVDDSQKNPSMMVEDQELDIVNTLFAHLVDSVIKEGVKDVDSFNKTLIGRMVADFDSITSSGGDERNVSSSFTNKFSKEIATMALEAGIKLDSSEAAKVASMFPVVAERFSASMSRKNAIRELQQKERQANEKSSASAGTAKGGPTGEAAVAADDGGARGKGDRQVQKEGAQANASKAGKTGAGQEKRTQASGAGPDVDNQAAAELIAARSATTSKVDALENAAAIPAEIADKLRTAISIADKPGLVAIGNEIVNLQEASHNASQSRRKNRDRQLQSISEFRDAGLIDDEAANDLSSRINSARTPDDQAAIDRELEKIEAKKADVRSRMSQSDPDAIESVNLQTGVVTPPSLIPDSIENIEHNIKSNGAPKKAVLEEALPSDWIKATYSDIKTTLRKIALESAVEPTASGVIRATVARSMMNRLIESGVRIQFVSSSEMPGVLGKYDIKDNVITIADDVHTNTADLENTILEESIHAFTSRTKIAADVDPESLSESQREAISGISSLIGSAKKAGLKWQQSESTDGSVVFDEFIAAVIRDKAFQDQLAEIPFEKDFVIKKAKNLFDAIKLQISKLIEAVISRYPIFGEGGNTDGMTALDASFVFVNTLIANHRKVSDEFAAKAQTGTRFRHVDGTLGTGTDITVDGSKFAADATSEAKRLMALQNLLQDAMTRMVNLWQSKGNNLSSQGAQLLSSDQAVKSMIVGAISESMPMPSDAKQAINKALTDQGASAIQDTITMGDLEQKSDAPKVARDGLNALNTVLFNLKKMRSEAEELFGKKNILQKIADSSFEISELTKKFEDMTFIGKEFVKELRRSINESEDVGAGSIAKAMGLTNGRKAALQSASTWIQANLNTFTDSLAALSELGVDFKNTPPADILKAVNAAAANDARLVPMQDIGRLAMAGQFARRRPMVMDLLSTRRSGEAGALRSIIAMATSSRPDAIELAKRDLTKLKKIGAAAARIIDRLSEMKANHRSMLDLAKLHAEREQFAVDAEAALVERIKYLERMLGVEATSVSGSQWKPHNNSTYFVPTSANQSEAMLFQDDPKSPSYRVLRFGPDFNGAEIRKELDAMKKWVDANQNLRGTGNYNLMLRQIDGLSKVYVEQMDANVKRGPSGFLVRALGSSADRLEQLGIRPAKEAATMMRRYVAAFEQSLRSVDAKSFHEFDALMRKGVELTGLHPKEFKRQYYNRPLGYLETRQDLLDPKISPQTQEDVLVKEAISYIEETTPMGEELKSTVSAILRTAGRNGDIIVGRNRANFGLKVADVMKDGRVYLREPIGHPLSTAARSLHEDLRVLGRKMFDPWNSMFNVAGETESTLKKSAVAELYQNDQDALRTVLSSRFTDEVINKFVKPLVNKTGQSNFKGPEKLGVVDMAKRENLVEAFRLSGGDMIRFAEELHRLEGGDPSNLVDFVGQTIATFQSYASNLFSITNAKGATLDEDSDAGLNFLNARQGEDFPWEWLDYKEYGYKNRTRYLRVMAQQFAFGDSQDGFNGLIEDAKAQLTQFKNEYEAAQALKAAGDRAGYEKALNEGGNRVARQNAAANLIELDAAAKRHKSLMQELNGAKQSAGVFSELLGVVSGFTVQGFATASTDSVTLFESPLRKFGFNKESIQFIAGTWKATGTEIAGSLAQAFGVQFHQDTATARETEILNRNGLADSDSITARRGFMSMHERYIQELGEELAFSAITDRYKDQPIKMAAELARGAGIRVARAGKVFMEAGIGKAKDPNQAYASLKLLNPFTQASIWMHRAAARQWLRTINNTILKAEIYFKSHPSAESDPSFRFTEKELGYSGRSLTGMKLDNRAWTFLSEKLAQAGISIEDAARKKMRGEDPLNFNQIQSAMSLAQTEILLNTSPVTRPAWSQDTLAGRLSTPLVGWALYKTADVAKSAAGPKSKGDLKSFLGFMEAMLLGVLPISLAYAFVRDEYEEEVLKKKQNVMPLRLDATLPAAMLDATSRLGMLGIIGEIPNSIVNQSTQREVSIDSRVFAVSSALNLMKTMSTLYNQGGTVTFQSVVRPMMQSFGGSGYLQNFDAINGLAGLDNVESRLAKRINVGNHLRVAGRMNDIEIRSGKGMVTTANPVKPHVVNMVLAAYANDARSFRESYQKALMAAKDHYPDSDPYEKVASAFESQHPLKSVFSTRPTTAEYQKMLLAMGDEGAEVGTAIRNLNSYGSQVLTKRGGTGIKPFYGTETTKRSTDYRSMLTR